MQLSHNNKTYNTIKYIKYKTPGREDTKYYYTFWGSCIHLHIPVSGKVLVRQIWCFHRRKFLPKFRQSWLPFLRRILRLHVHKNEDSTFFRNVGKYYPITHPQNSKRLASFWISLPALLRAAPFCCRIFESRLYASNFIQYTTPSL